MPHLGGRTCRGAIPTTTLVLLAVLLQLMDLGGGPAGEPGGGVMLVAAAVCKSQQHWWDPAVQECVPCRVCGANQIVIRPCQDHMDAACGTLKDLTGPTHHHWSEERRKEGDGVRRVVGPSPTSTEEILWDWQVASLLLAIIGCLLFLLAAACVALNQSRQWRRIEKHFDADMEALSAQLVSHLASMQHLESGPILLENFDHGRLRSAGHQPIEVRCVYLDQLLEEKCAQKARNATPAATGNLYIEESIDTASTRVHSPVPSIPARSPAPPPPIVTGPLRPPPIRHY
uniref:TNFR-Cys domain-containing protein n=1 Tax=Anopheles dirus TaxID=7168 RepID=A0A182N1C8_9DIPT